MYKEAAVGIFNVKNICVSEPSSGWTLQPEDSAPPTNEQDSSDSLVLRRKVCFLITGYNTAGASRDTEIMFTHECVSYDHQPCELIGA